MSNSPHKVAFSLSGVAITAYACTSALGPDCDALRAGLVEGKSGLQRNAPLPGSIGPLPFAACVGVVETELAPAPFPPIHPSVTRYPDTRQLRMAWHVLRQIEPQVRHAIARVGSARVGLILGTSTGGIASTEEALSHLRDHDQLPAEYSCLDGHAMDAAVRHIADVLDVRGPAFATSSACASGAKALATAKRLIEAGLCDVVLAGGIDSLARMTIHGFHSLGVLAEDPCRPFDQAGRGMNVAEGGAWLLVERSQSGAPAMVSLIGVGESSDAHHMSAPDPSGQSQLRAMSAALSSAQIEAGAVGYVNAHGTGTRANDSAEQTAIVQLLGQVPASSTKGLIGHQLGAAGAIETVIAAEVARGLALSNAGAVDPTLFPLEKLDRKGVLSNSFAFGGANISLLLTAQSVSTCQPPAAPRMRARVRAMSALSIHPDFAPRTSRPQPDQVFDAATMGSHLLGARGRARASELTRLFAESVSWLGATKQELSQMPIFVGSALGQIQTSKALIELYLNNDASPLAFQGSVHNTTAGVLSIALGNHAPSSSIAGGDDTLFATLVEGMSYLHPEQCPEILVLIGDETPPTALGLMPYASAVAAFILTHPDRCEQGPLLEIVHRATPAAAPLPIIETPSALAGHICGEATGLVEWLLHEDASGSATVRRRRPLSPWELVAHASPPAQQENMFPPIHELLPHRPPLLLLKEVVSFDDRHISCLVDAPANVPFADAEGVDCVVATEWMAQAVGAFVGAKKRSEGRAPQVGFIIGIRKVDFHTPKVKNAAHVRVTAEPVWVDRASGSFNCSVMDMTNNNIIATGSLTVHEPGS